jgi:L-fuculose-phosphate aldolase
MDSSWSHPREDLVQTMARIYRYHMTTTSGGNLSILDPDGSIWITPSRVDKGNLKPTDVVRVTADGSVEGQHPPSSEFPFHRQIYERRPDIKAIVHAHPGALVAYSICRLIPELRVQSHAHAVCGKIAYAPYACPGSEQLGENIADAFATGADCVMLENHGVVIGGSDLHDAFQRFETLEFVAQTLVKANRLGDVTTLTDAQLEISGPGFGEIPAAPASNREKELRSRMCDFVHRAYEQRLLISTAGAFSARLDDGEYLITPHRRDRLELEPANIVRAKGFACEAGKTPPACTRKFSPATPTSAR